MRVRNKCSNAKKVFAKKLRANLTKGEKLLWVRLREKQLGVWFYPQSILFGYIVDFWCPSAGVVVEVDGPSHLRQRDWDRKRDAVLLRKGIITMRFLNAEVENSTNAVVALIMSKVAKRLR